MRGNWGTIKGISSKGPSISERLMAATMGLAQSVVHVLQVFEYRCDLYRSRRQLADLSDEQLLDVGLTRAQVDAETSRPFFPD